MEAPRRPPRIVTASHPLHAVLNPGSVAVIGASEDPGKFGGRALRFLTRHGYAGRIVPVNPTAATLLGHRVYARIGDAPGPIDVALLALPAPALPAALDECGRAGVRCAVVLTADFAETGPEGAARETVLVAAARAHGMRLIGPNCLGFINPGARLALTSSVALAAEPMPQGEIGLVSQSGSLMASPHLPRAGHRRRLHRRRLRGQSGGPGSLRFHRVLSLWVLACAKRSSFNTLRSIIHAATNETATVSGDLLAILAGIVGSCA